MQNLRRCRGANIADVEVVEEPVGELAKQAEIPISFLVDRRFDVVPVDGGLGGFTLTEVPVDPPWTKDYDAVPAHGPHAWASRFDVSRWGLLGAHDGGRRVGGAVIVFGTPGVDMLEGRTDLAVLWDLRVRPEARRSGAGTMLFRAAEDWARARGCTWLKIETQDVNANACRFYAAMGCTLGALDRFAYPELPDEVALLWRKPL